EHLRLIELSSNSTVLGCNVEEHVMYSSAFHYEHGRFAWSLTHDSANGLFDLQSEGVPPEFFPEAFAKGVRDQMAAGGINASVDYLFGVPLEIAARICGYRHDQWKFEWGEPKFTELRAAS